MGKYYNLYHAEADSLILPAADPVGRVEWECPSNIALVKYWGKSAGQIPLYPSLSFTLSECVTRMSVEFQYHRDQSFMLDFAFDGNSSPVFEDKLQQYCMQVSAFMPFLRFMHLRIRSGNSFPHSAGIASSASSYGALALALCSMEKLLFGTLQDDADFYRKASFLARMGSGSASRSVYGGVVLWGQIPENPESAYEVAIPLTAGINPVFRSFRDSVLVVFSKQKPVSSTEGHRLMQGHPYAAARIEQAGLNLNSLLKLLNGNNPHEVLAIVEHEALSLHALMMSSVPGYLLITPKTIEIIGLVRAFRQNTGVPLGFTLDAGPNVHVLYPASYQDVIREFIDEQLRPLCEEGKVIHDHVGNGPVKLQ